MSDPTDLCADCADLNEATARYLEAIYRLSQEQPASNIAISERLDVTPSSVSLMLRRLTQRGLVKTVPYKGTVLTPQGLSIALRVVRRHRLLEVFLMQTLDFKWHEVDAHARTLQATLTAELEDRIDRFTGYPKRCPHGHVIPDKNGALMAVSDVQLVTCPPGTRGVVRRVDTEDADWLEYLGELGLMPGAEVRLQSIAPHGGAVTIAFARHVITLGFPLAKVIWIEIQTDQTHT